MVDISAIAGAVSALKSAVDITKTMIGLHDAEAIKAKVIELNSKILEAQSAAFAANDERSTLIQRVGSLEKEIADLKAWDAEKANYKLVNITNSQAKAYAPKDTMEGAEPSHYLCANCYTDNKKSFLQSETRFPGRTHVLVCHRCGADLYVMGGWQPEHAKRRT